MTAPFLKWAGGKQRLLEDILPHLPARCGTYFEPFLGGGAVFFRVAREGRFDRAVLGDTNRELVGTYRVVKRRLPPLVQLLRHHQVFAADPEYFYRLREIAPAELDPVERAARFIALNRTCYNGLFRVNAEGRFNVPHGRYRRPRVLDEARLEAASRALRRARLVCADFEDLVLEAKRGDAVYLDPPYLPAAPTSFVAYGADHFSEDDHRRLASCFRGLHRRGVGAVLSGSCCRASTEVYQDLEVVHVHRPCTIGRRRRGHVTEMLAIGGATWS